MALTREISSRKYWYLKFCDVVSKAWEIKSEILVSKAFCIMLKNIMTKLMF